MRKIVLVFIGIIFFASTLSAQTRTIRLWPDGVPNSKKDSAYQQRYFTAKKLREANIKNPILDYYPAPTEEANGTAIIICPGGGYTHLSIVYEGSAVAKWLNTLGITAFVLKYRLPSSKIMIDKNIGPLQDAQRAMRIVRSHAKQWKINPHKIGIMGFSAGGHVASTLSTHYSQNVYDVKDTVSARPDFSILLYPVISMKKEITHMGSRIALLGKTPNPAIVKLYSNELQVTKNTPPAFLVQAMNDPAVSVQNSIDYALALKKYKIPVELHLYERGGHGFGLAENTKNTESSWPEACANWLKMNNFL